MISIFDVPWRAVELEHVQAFLAEAGEEGLTWDAKSDGVLSGRGGQLKTGSIAKAACAFANQLGGYTIVGAERRSRDSPWELPGVTLPGDEPELWLGKAIGQLRPVPKYEIKVWPAAHDGRHIAVVRVEPVTRTPCMTRDGRVYERVTSESLPVDDPSRLHDLLQRGEQARTRARDNASLSLGLFRDHTDKQFPTGSGVFFGVAMSAISYEPDIGRRLFTYQFARLFLERFVARLFAQPHEDLLNGPKRQITQLAIRYEANGPNFHWWTAQAQWNGSVIVHARLKAQSAETLGIFPTMIEPAWTLAAELVEALGGYGEAYTQLIVDPRLPGQPKRRSLYTRLEQRNEFERWGDLAPPDDYDLDSIRRELDRAAGYWTLDDPPPKGESA